MGCYDTLVVHCHCGHAVPIQSKAGDCMLKTYTTAKTPLAIAASLNGQVIQCPKCKTRMRLKASTTTVRMEVHAAKPHKQGKKQ